MLAVELGSSGSSGSRTRPSTRAGLERRKKKKSRLDILKTLVKSL